MRGEGEGEGEGGLWTLHAYGTDKDSGSEFLGGGRISVGKHAEFHVSGLGVEICAS